MANIADINRVRRNVDEPDHSNGYTDTVIGALIDSTDINGASATIWQEKAAKWAGLGNISEGGASHNFSALSANALKMAEVFTADESAKPIRLGPVIQPITRN